MQFECLQNRLCFIAYLTKTSFYYSFAGWLKMFSKLGHQVAITCLVVLLVNIPFLWVKVPCFRCLTYCLICTLQPFAGKHVDLYMRL